MLWSGPKPKPYRRRRRRRSHRRPLPLIHRRWLADAAAATVPPPPAALGRRAVTRARRAAAAAAPPPSPPMPPQCSPQPAGAHRVQVRALKYMDDGMLLRLKKEELLTSAAIRHCFLSTVGGNLTIRQCVSQEARKGCQRRRRGRGVLRGNLGNRHLALQVSGEPTPCIASFIVVPCNTATHLQRICS